jgi:hypothetical protein
VDLYDLLLLGAFRRRISEPDFAAGLDRFRAIVGRPIDEDDFRAAIARALKLGHIYDPVRIPAGALQCHWCLEVTPKGSEAAQALSGSPGNR